MRIASAFKYKIQRGFLFCCVFSIISRCSKLFYTISRCYFHIESTFSGASISFVLSHIARYVPSPEENSCIPITHFQCKTHFEHLLSHIRSVFKSAAKVGNPIEMTNTPPRVTSHDGTIASHDGTFLRAHMDFTKLSLLTFTLHFAEYEVEKSHQAPFQVISHHMM